MEQEKKIERKTMNQRNQKINTPQKPATPFYDDTR